jgi:nucleotide-binding universal stress UspA family protein
VPSALTRKAGAVGAGRFTGLLLGSVGQHLIHHAACPIAIVRAIR